MPSSTSPALPPHVEVMLQRPLRVRSPLTVDGDADRSLGGAYGHGSEVAVHGEARAVVDVREVRGFGGGSPLAVRLGADLRLQPAHPGVRLRTPGTVHL